MFSKVISLSFEELANLGVQFPLHTAVDGLLKLLQKYAVVCRGPLADQHWKCGAEQAGYLAFVFV